MIHWLSQLWVSYTADRGGGPSRLWRWTFGRFASHRRLASELRQLDGQLKRQAASQRRAIAHGHLPVGRYPSRSTQKHDGTTAGPGGLFAGGRGWLWPTVTAGSLGAAALLGLVIWTAWPSYPTPTPGEIQAYTAESFARVWGPLARQAEMTGQALRTQTTQVIQLQKRLPTIDRVVNNLGETIQTPIREEVRRFAEDLREPWTYLAGQLPRLPKGHARAPKKT